MNSIGVGVTIAGGILALLGILAMAAAYYRMKFSKSTAEILKENNDALLERVQILEDSDARKTDKIAQLEGEVRALKTLPLAELAESYQAMANAHMEMVHTQKQIIELITDRRSTPRPMVTLDTKEVKKNG